MITSLYLSFSRTEPKMDSTGLEYILMGIGWSQECCQRDIKGRWGIVGTDGRGDFQGPPVKVICCYIKKLPQSPCDLIISGLLCGFSGKEFTCQCRRKGSDP